MTERAAAPKMFLIADVRRYTLLTSERGDEAAASLVDLFAGVIEKTVSTRDGSVVEFRGDERWRCSTRAVPGSGAAVEVQAASARGEDGRPVPVGIGLANCISALFLTTEAA
jgi:class 3 adenylate cyclase